MKNKKVTILTICVVLLLIALIGVSVFCIHLINKENAGTKEVVSSRENTASEEVVPEVTPEPTPEPTPGPTPEPTPEPPALHIVQADLQRKYHNDEPTATLLEKGYFHEVSETQTDDTFEVNLVGFTGDALTPMILLDVTVKDETLLSEEDRIFIDLHCLGTTQYENNKDSYGTKRAYGVRDSENSNLFHVSMKGLSRWMVYGEEFVIGINSISIGSSEKMDLSWDVYDVNMEYRITVPTSTYKPVVSFGYEHTVFEDDGLTYHVDIITPSYYYTELRICCDYSNSELANITQEGDLLAALYDASDDFVKDLVLTTNGQANEGDPETTSAVTIEGNKAYFYTDFPGVDTKLLYSMILTHGETSYTLK